MTFGSSEVGVFRLKTGTTYLKREIEFQPLAPIPLKGTNLGNYLESRFQEFRFELDGEGGVTVKLGPHKKLGPVAGLVSFAYKRLLAKEAL